ncbi:MAG TPA: hypothetical protein PLZ08_12585 [Bacillota bacterium]|nr:hypothetical protein [Bacillota bacterium]HOL10890.1 hypothetical protein [Bacillota bacterium]HPO98774.1 hypothetical protein [Bacillota bacterium]
MDLSKVKMVAQKTLLTLETEEFNDLERLINEMKAIGWEIEKFPRYSFGSWQATVSQCQKSPLGVRGNKQALGLVNQL